MVDEILNPPVLSQISELQPQQSEVPKCDVSELSRSVEAGNTIKINFTILGKRTRKESEC